MYFQEIDQLQPRSADERLAKARLLYNQPLAETELGIWVETKNYLFETFEVDYKNVYLAVTDTLMEQHAKSNHAVNIVLNLKTILPMLCKVVRIAKQYDVNPYTPGNGYWSVAKSFLAFITSLHIELSRVVLPGVSFSNLIPEFDHIVESFLVMFRVVDEIFTKNDTDSLFCSTPLQATVDTCLQHDFSCFYGDFFGQHYSNRIRQLFDIICGATASFGKGFEGASHSSMADIVGATLFAPSMMAKKSRAKMLYALFMDITVEFTQYYWNKTELASRHFAVLMAPVASCNTRIRIETKPFWFQGKLIDAPRGSESIRFRVISNNGFDASAPVNTVLRRKSLVTRESVRMAMEDCDLQGTDAQHRPKTQFSGQLDELEREPISIGEGDHEYRQLNKLLERAASTREAAGESDAEPRNFDGLLVHFHGGGFVAQTSRSHQVYLRRWSQELNLVVLSVDYTLAPEGRFPVAAEECFFIYCWARRFRAFFGCSEDAPVFVSGDSAGGNLCMATAMMALDKGVEPPSGIHCNYPALNLRMGMSPARLLSAMDGLLNIHILMLCLREYSPLGANAFDVATMDPSCSPWHASDDVLANLPSVYMTACELDPLMDDAVDFARRLYDVERQGKRHKPSVFAVLTGCPHGFLNLLGCGDELVSQAERTCFEMLKSMLSDYGMSLI